MVKFNNYIVTGEVKGRRERISTVMTRGRAYQFIKKLNKQMAISPLKYKFVKNLRVEFIINT